MPQYMPRTSSLKTREVRWFLPKPWPDLVQWFEGLSVDAYSREVREDRYLLLPRQVALGVKVREGRLELKYRIGTPGRVWVAPGVPGRLEEWEKFSLQTEADGPCTIEGGVAAGWLPVLKRRLVTLVTAGEDGPSFHAPDQAGRAGVQLEYTELEIEGTPGTTIGLEWPSESGVRLPETFLGELLGKMGLQADDSMGYPEFLLKRAVSGWG